MYVFTYKIGIKPINSAVNCTFQVNKSVYFLHDLHGGMCKYCISQYTIINNPNLIREIFNIQ